MLAEDQKAKSVAIQILKMKEICLQFCPLWVVTDNHVSNRAPILRVSEDFGFDLVNRHINLIKSHDYIKLG